ncbi:MAG: hypothetical protein AWT59_1525 [Candidatus Gallionella acididurans]|uniref:Uncharacterized protein n=1 Tax=Candidatus Gallionella acididurans TaxID=1796491 RepID=A0A139BTT7_9PROT|nr:MAG: hypothetical protein AWT59_1525 [Candidatus Gallionella acididurans]
MCNEYEPDYSSDNKYYRSGNEYLLQHFHIFSLSE